MNAVESEILNSLLPNKKYILAVSGGVDSSVMLYVCNLLSEKINITLSVAHIDHNFRKESIQDRHFVEQTCLSLKIPFYLKVLNPEQDLKLLKNKNLENYGRNERYRFLNELLAETETDFILTAHNSNDVAETFLMNLFANKELNSIAKVDLSRKCIRPLLGVSKNNIIEYAKNNNILFVEDATNKDIIRTRNKIRHNVIPNLQNEFGFDIVKVLYLQSKRIETEKELLKSHYNDYIQKIKKFNVFEKEWIHCIKTILSSLQELDQAMLIRLVFKEIVFFNLNEQHSLKLAHFFIHSSSPYIELSGGFSLRKNNGQMILLKDNCRVGSCI